MPDWALAHGECLFAARIRSTPSDFQVVEQSEFNFSNDGEHDYLFVEKTGSNTQWLAERLARYANIPVRDVGFAGLKDRRAITRQWFSVRRAADTDWSLFVEDGVRLLQQHRHRRKLRRGAHKGNAFRLALRGSKLLARREQIEHRLQTISRLGVPNYFGEQRFGIGGANIELCRQVIGGRRMAKTKRSIALSAGRSLIFNAILDARVRQGSWNRILPGELANLDGSASVFAVDAVTDELTHRCDTHDIHPSGSLWGKDSPMSGAAVAELESRVANEFQELADGIANMRMQAASRALRLRVNALSWELEDEVLWLEFELPKGAYATAVIRELAST